MKFNRTGQINGYLKVHIRTASLTALILVCFGLFFMAPLLYGYCLLYPVYLHLNLLGW
ncbi:hypothetical protein RO3G_02159 [Rhizopus delemar RA 99-880]|uniref:Uncharacterized protein n=1 Tax=Rhizopus delemar (strain RA 99-880 / ATCC MYA-4621 / FGSC 9543 / NRRL 43880) TaxID=246409 RepID=I1BMM5_RHIO9|nr:hypothetical protein RO3G_02159 [Rhizopus delemar RA 99-880]|eukprot:EIE77455.1 hypothetical protein RO3G_02159 [Rhizopus delemar RA 99-880]